MLSDAEFGTRTSIDFRLLCLSPFALAAWGLNSHKSVNHSNRTASFPLMLIGAIIPAGASTG